MVKNKGFLPSAPSEITVQRKQLKDIIYSLYSACKDADADTGVPFKADAIIANPPAYGVVLSSFAQCLPYIVFSWFLFFSVLAKLLISVSIGHLFSGEYGKLQFHLRRPWVVFFSN